MGNPCLRTSIVFHLNIIPWYTFSHEILTNDQSLIYNNNFKLFPFMEKKLQLLPKCCVFNAFQCPSVYIFKMKKIKKRRTHIQQV